MAHTPGTPNNPVNLHTVLISAPTDMPYDQLPQHFQDAIANGSYDYISDSTYDAALTLLAKNLLIRMYALHGNTLFIDNYLKGEFDCNQLLEELGDRMAELTVNKYQVNSPF